MKWDAWGDPAAAKPLSDGVRSLLKQVVGLADSEQPELDPAQVQLRPSALSGADHDALARIVGTEYFRTADRDRLLHAGGKSTPDLLRRKDTGVQDAPDAVLLPGGPNGEDAVADILHYCSDHGIAVVPFGGGTSVVGGLDPVRNDFRAVISLDMRRFDRLHRIGGDGVVSNALQVLAGTDIPLGIIPAGTGNDHAREFGLPTKNPKAAADIVVDGWTETIDLGRIQDDNGIEKWFGTVAATGFDSLVNDRANRMRWPHGRMRYYIAMLAELSRLRPLPFRLVLDGTEEIVADLTLADFGNTRSYGGGLLICPNADHSDGLLDITMAQSDSRTKLLRLFPTIFKGAHVELDEVSTTRAKTVHVECPGINVYADGDFACPLPAEISAVPAALQVLRPRHG